MNIQILDGILHIGTEERAEEIKAELNTLTDCLRESKEFSSLVRGSLAAIALNPGKPQSIIAALLIHAMHIGITYAKAEREVAELENIT